MKRKYVQAMMTGMTAMLAVTVPVTTVAAATPEKEQTVYVNADQNGNVEKVIVSNWLKNTDKESTGSAVNNSCIANAPTCTVGALITA